MAFTGGIIVKTLNRMLAIVLASMFIVAGSHKAQAQITVLDEKTVKVEARGMIDGIKSKKKREGLAFKKAKENAVLMVVNDMLREADEVAAFEKIKEEFLEASDTYIQHASYKHKANYDKPAYQTTVVLDVRIDRDLLQKELIKRGIIAAAADVRKELDRFAIMPYLDVAGSSDEALKYKELFYTRVRVFFEDQNIPTVGQDEAMAIEMDEEMLAMAKGSAGKEGEEDPALQIARNTPADIFIKITATVESGTYAGNVTKKVILTVGAYNVMTGEFIGSGQGFSEPMALSSEGASVGAGIDQAMNSAMTRVMDRVTSFWRDYVKDGRPIKLVFTDFTFEDTRWIRKSLQELAKDQKRLKAAGNVSEYMVWYDGSAEDLMYELYDVFVDNNVPQAEDPVLISNTIRFYRQK
jgi:hypothetical protein